MSDYPSAVEANADGLVGPTHSYAGLSPGNLASENNAGAASTPRGAPLEGLAKMALLSDLGLPQFLLPPQDRPDLAFLRPIRSVGTDAPVLAAPWRHHPAIGGQNGNARAFLDPPQFGGIRHFRCKEQERPGP